MPPPLRRRGAAVERAKALEDVTEEPDLASEVARREVVDVDTLRRIGVANSSAATGPVVRAGQWLMSADRAERTAHQVLQMVTEHDRERPLDRGLPVTVLAERLDLPSPELVAAVLREPLHLDGGRVLASDDDALPAELEQALAALADDLRRTRSARPPPTGSASSDSTRPGQQPRRRRAGCSGSRRALSCCPVPTSARWSS